MTQTLQLLLGDCLVRLDGIAPESIPAMISDPPYHIAFMGKKWDTEEAGIAFSQEFWSRVYRVLKPGGTVKAFSGTRTFHRMAAAMEEAGFVLEPKTSLEAWMYGSGFPKSMNISKQIDKQAGAEREVVGPYRTPEGGQVLSTYNNWQSDAIQEGEQGRRVPMVTSPATSDAERWEGWGTALKPAFEPILVGRKPT
jgi:hypothetical protein